MTSDNIKSGLMLAGVLVAGYLAWTVYSKGSAAAESIGKTIDSAKKAVEVAWTGSLNFVDPTSPTGGLQTSAQGIAATHNGYLNTWAGDPAFTAKQDAAEKQTGFYLWLNGALNKVNLGVPETTKFTGGVTDTEAGWDQPANTGGYTGTW